MPKIWSWNVNGLRAAIKKGFAETIEEHQPDIICLQEIRTNEPIELANYYSYWSFAEKKGYSGLAIFTREKPELAEGKLGIKKIRCSVLSAHLTNRKSRENCSQFSWPRKF